MTSLEKLYDILDSDPNLKRMKSLEKYFTSNEEVLDLIHKKQHISKEIINAKILGLKNTVKEYQHEYDLVNEEISNYPFLDEYLDLLEYYNDLLKSMVEYLENKINNGLNSDR